MHDSAARPSAWMPTAAGLSLWLAGLFVFVASCSTLVLELVVSRLLSPYVGVSLYTWTSVIGVVLAGVSLGNWAGGRLVDRAASPRLIGLLFLLGGLSTLAILLVVAALGDGSIVRPLPLLARVLLLTSLVAFLPSFLLAAVTPVSIKLALPELGRTGRYVGALYALGTMGSLGGNFLTGFVLVAFLPVSTIVLGVGLLLLVVGLLASWQSKKSPALASTAGHGPGSAAEDERDDRLHAPARRRRLDLAGNVLFASLVVVVASFCTMAIELAASRILAPHVGVSLYSWTGIIGVVLAGIALGNYLGGRLADRWRSQRLLGLSLFASGLAGLAIVQAVEAVTRAGLFVELGLMERIVALTATIFFVPVMLLGTISPQVIRLAVTDLGHVGRVAGRVYAWSTAGAILGTFATGWWLISLLGVYPLVFAASLGLLLLALVVGRFWLSPAGLAGGLVVGAMAVGVVWTQGALQSPCTLETNYFCITVIDDQRDGQPVKALVLDHLIHSYVRLGDPAYLGYEHEQVQAELTRLVAARTSAPRVLVIGGGGYTFPRWVERFVPSASIEVVEIDPGVTEVARTHLGLSPETRIVSHHLDGRQFVQELAGRQRYQLVVQDAVNDLSVPYHILTKEYIDDVRALMTEDGFFLLTVIDLYEDGQLLRAAVRTMMESFPSVQLLAAQPVWEYAGSNVFVIAGSNRPLDLTELGAALRQQGVSTMRTQVQPAAALEAYVRSGPPIILTDQYAPVDNLIVPLFRSRYS